MIEKIFNKEENKKYNENSILLNLIKDNSGPDPFWEDCLIKYFENVNKTEQEKIEFFSNLINDKELFNEFTKEIVGPSNLDELFDKYNKIMNNKENNQYIFYKKNETDLVWWVQSKERRFGEHLFSFDKKKIFNLFRDYPHKLTKEEKEIFDKENSYWKEFFSDRKN